VSTYPLSSSQLKDTLNGAAQKGWSWNQTVSFLSPLGYTSSSLQNQLRGMGYSSAQLSKIVSSKGSELKSILNQVGEAALPIPSPSAGLGEALAGGAAADAGASAAGAEAGAAGAAAAGAGASAAQTVAAGAALAGIWEWLTTASHWVRIAEYIGGAVLIYIAVRQLAGAPSAAPSPSTIVKAVAK
jgi:hypothetical protein